MRNVCIKIRQFFNCTLFPAEMKFSCRFVRCSLPVPLSSYYGSYPQERRENLVSSYVYKENNIQCRCSLRYNYHFNNTTSLLPWLRKYKDDLGIGYLAMYGVCPPLRVVLSIFWSCRDLEIPARLFGEQIPFVRYLLSFKFPLLSRRIVATFSIKY